MRAASDEWSSLPVNVSAGGGAAGLLSVACLALASSGLGLPLKNESKRPWTDTASNLRPMSVPRGNPRRWACRSGMTLLDADVHASFELSSKGNTVRPLASTAIGAAHGTVSCSMPAVGPLLAGMPSPRTSTK